MKLSILLTLLALSFQSFGSNLIIGGTLVNQNEPIARSTVGLSFQTYQGTSTCTGTILSNNIVITAAHCVTTPNNELINPDQMKIIFGTDMRSSRAMITPELVYIPADYHGLTNSTEMLDFAILFFKEKIPFGFGPAKVLKSEEYLNPGDIVTLAGYGITNSYSNTGGGLLRKTNVAISHFENDSEVVLDERFGSGACRGDSGGPAYILRNGEYYFFGVTSRGDLRCSQRGIYTLLSSYSELIFAAKTEFLNEYMIDEVLNFQIIENYFNLSYDFETPVFENKLLIGQC